MSAADRFPGVDTIDDRVEISLTSSGVRVVSDPVPDARSASISIWIGAGSRDEPSAMAGACHFLEHLIFQGTERRGAHEVNVAIDAVGGDLNAYTAKETTAFFAQVPAADVGMAAELLCEMVNTPRLDPDDVETERDVILEELAMVNDTPDELAMTLLVDRLFSDHGLGWETLGREETLKSMSRDDLAGFHQRWYNPANIVVAAAGAVIHDDVLAIVDRGLSERAPVRPTRVVPAPVESGAMTMQRETEQVHLAYGWRGLEHQHPDRFALTLLLHTLGQGPSSRLYRVVRDELGLAYSVFSSHSMFSDTGLISIYCATNPANLDQVRTVIDSQLSDIIGNGITDEELRISAGYVCGSAVMALEDHGTKMSRLGSALINRGEIEPVRTSLDAFGAVTLDDIVRVAECVLGVEPITVAVGPVDPAGF